MHTLEFVGLCGSLRQASRNKALLRAAATRLPEGVTLTVADLSDIPFFNADLTTKPASVERVLAQFARADALVMASPEYNYSIAPALKNILDWASREPNNALLAGKTAALMGGGGAMGTSRAQYHLRQVCVYLDLHPVNKPEVLVNLMATSFAEDGTLTDEKVLGLIGRQMQALADWTRTVGPRGRR